MESVQMEENKQILVAITELKANVKHMSDQLREIGKIGQTVVETVESVKSAHKRIDDVKTDYESKLRTQKADYEEKIRGQKEDLIELKSHITWLWRTVGAGAIAFLFWVIQFFMTKGV